MRPRPTPRTLSVVEAILASVKAGWNVIDTAVNYRQQKGERCVGKATHHTPHTTHHTPHTTHHIAHTPHTTVNAA